MTWLVLLVLAGCSPPDQPEPGPDPEPFTYLRAYEPGATWAYELTTTHLRDGAFDKREIGRSTQLVSDGGGFETTTWTGLTVEQADGTVLDLQDRAEAMPSYPVSMLEGSVLVLPELVVPEMTGMVTDHFTYYVAVSHNLGVGDLHEAGDVVDSPEPVLGDWSDGQGTPTGQDCILPAIELIELGDVVTFETRFSVPEANSCFDFVRPEWGEPVVGGLANNFQQVVDLGGQQIAMYGAEWFTIRSDVDRADGRILRASMENRLDLRILGGCDADWLNCAQDGPLVIEREELLVAIGP